MKKLTAKQEKFISEYLVDLNASAAYVRAGYSKKLSNTNSGKLLQITAIKKEIDRRKKEDLDKLKITREYIINEYLELIKSSKEEGVYGDGNLKDRTNWAKALSQLSKLLGLDEPDKQIVHHEGITINYNIPPSKKNE